MNKTNKKNLTCLQNESRHVVTCLKNNNKSKWHFNEVFIFFLMLCNFISIEEHNLIFKEDNKNPHFMTEIAILSQL